MNSIATIEMEITPYMEEQFKGEPFLLEIEMLQGERELLPNGKIKYKIEIYDKAKAHIMKAFLQMMISTSHKSRAN